MKWIWTLALVLVVAACAGEQEAEETVELNLDSSDGIPSFVTKDFESRFPNAADVEWDGDADSYEAEFTIDGVEYEVEYSAEGEWNETEKKIDASQLPEAVSDAVTQAYQGMQIVEACWIKSADFDPVYEVELGMEGEEDAELEVHVAPDGTIIQRGSKDDDKDAKAGGEETETMGGAEKLLTMPGAGK